MGNLLNINNPIISGINKVLSCILVCVLWLICCIPVFTIGTSTTALYYTVQKVIKNDRGYIISEFFKSFRTNFKQTTPVWLVMLAIALILIGDIRILQMIVNSGNAWGNVYVFFELLLLVEVIYAIYVFSFFARFKNITKEILKNAAILAVKHIGSTIKILFILLFGGIIIYIIPLSVFIIPVVIVWFISVVLEKIYYRYMSGEDKNAEDARNMEYNKKIV
jgi:uncharacterized membrane protein YesL